MVHERDLPDPGIEPASPALACGFFTTEPPGKPHSIFINMCIFRRMEGCFKILIAVILNDEIIGDFLVSVFLF